MGHSILSPSSMHRIIGCAASLAESDGRPNDGNKYAWEGTAAHTLMSWCLEQGLPALAFLGAVIEVWEETGPKNILTKVAEYEADEEMAAYVQVFIDQIYAYMEMHDDAQLFVEVKVDFTPFVECPLDDNGDPIPQDGTSDTVILFPAQRRIHVSDLKYGRGVEVGAEENEQMMSYALGVINTFNAYDDYDTVTMSIHQPRITEKPSEWEISVADLLKWAKSTLRPATSKALMFRDLKRQGVVIDAAHYKVDDDNCKFCKGKANCRVYREFVETAVGVHFDDLDAMIAELDDKPAPIPVPTEDEELDALYPKLDMVYDWVSAVQSRIYSRMMAGVQFENAFLKEGRKGHRKWKDEKRAERDLKAMRLKIEEMYAMKLISPAQAEDRFKDNPKRLKKLLANVTQAPGRASVADRRAGGKEWKLPVVEFDDLDAGGVDDLA